MKRKRYSPQYPATHVGMVTCAVACWLVVSRVLYEVHEMLLEVDKDGDGAISYEEFEVLLPPSPCALFRACSLHSVYSVYNVQILVIRCMHQLLFSRNRAVYNSTTFSESEDDDMNMLRTASSTKKMESTKATISKLSGSADENLKGLMAVEHDKACDAVRRHTGSALSLAQFVPVDMSYLSLSRAGLMLSWG